MTQQVLLSICIPAYKHITFLRRLLDSISIQTYVNYEVIVTDDSPDDSVQQLCLQYSHLPLRYFRNSPALGSPGNWNSAIGHATGKWIKIMHDDDWFSHPDSLEKFARAAQHSHDTAFIFSGVYEVNTGTGSHTRYIPGRLPVYFLRRSPLYLFRKNYIGHPSTTLIKNNITEWYDERVKWVVDFEFYIRYLLLHKKFLVIREPLISIGINEHQITKEAFRNPAIEIPEHLYFYHKLPVHSFKNIVVYDYYWRLWRNLGVRTVNDIQPYFPQAKIPEVLGSMIKWQSKIPLRVLQTGIFSKILMVLSYAVNYKRL